MPTTSGHRVDDYLDLSPDVVKSNPFAYNVQRFNIEDTAHIAFRVAPKHLQRIIVQLGDIGCGDEYGTIDVTATVLSRPAPPLRQTYAEGKKRLYRINDRMTIDEIEVRCRPLCGELDLA